MRPERYSRAVPFSGSYDPEDVCFLLKPVALAPTDVRTKERLIQSGQRHYSEMIAPEKLPDPDYLALFHAAERRHRARLAADLASLAAHLAERAGGRELVIASLARAGTPIGVVLTRLLRRWSLPVVHYAISIIRDRGIDQAALAYIAARHDPRATVFVDGWTGKGAIAEELRRSLWDDRYGFKPMLAVVADPAGAANVAAGGDDYLIASGLLNGIISGLVSRSILNADLARPNDFHACVSYPQLAAHDLSRSFVDALEGAAADATIRPIHQHMSRRPELRRRCEAIMTGLMARCEVGDRNRIKPGIAEATRALLRRVPERLFVRDPEDPDVAHLVHLARVAGVPLDLLEQDCAYRAVAVIRPMAS